MDSPPLCMVSTWELSHPYTRIFSFRLGTLAGSRSQFARSMVRISGCCMLFKGFFCLSWFFCGDVFCLFFPFCNIIVGTGILEGLWFAVLWEGKFQ